MSSEDFFPAEVRPRRAPLTWERRRPLGWAATTFHGTYEIRPHCRLHYIDGSYKLAWRRGDGFAVRYRPQGAAEHTHLPQVTTWFLGIAEAKDAIRGHHDQLVRENRAPKRRERPSRRLAAARASLRAALARRHAFLQPGLPLRAPEEPLMPRRCRRNALSLGDMIDRELERVFRSFELQSPPPARARRRRLPNRSHLRVVEVLPPTPAAPPASSAPKAPEEAAPSTLSPELQAYIARFPTCPAWMKDLEPEDIVLGVDPATGPRMADAEDGEQPWDSVPFPFVGPPDPGVA